MNSEYLAAKTEKVKSNPFKPRNAIIALLVVGLGMLAYNNQYGS